MQRRHCSYESIHCMQLQLQLQQYLCHARVGRGRESLCSDRRVGNTYENCMHAKQIIILFYICFYRTIFFIQLSTANASSNSSITGEVSFHARGKSVQKNSEVKRTSCNVVRLLCTHARTNTSALEPIY